MSDVWHGDDDLSNNTATGSTSLLEDGRAAKDAPAPVDRYRAAYFILFLQGMGMLFPWNVFINGESYFHRRFCGTSFADNFLSFFGVTFMMCNVIGLGISVKYGARFSVRRRVVVPLWINCAIFVFTTILTFFTPVGMNNEFWFFVVLFTVGLSGFCNAILQGGVFGTAGQMPGVYTQAVMGGQGLAGLTVSLSGVVTTAGRPASDSDKSICDEDYSNLQWSAFAYFLIACVVIVGSAVSWAFFERLPIAQHFIEVAASAQAERVSLNPRTNKADDDRTKLLAASDGGVLSIFRHIRTLAFAVWLTFAVTLSVFPAVTAKIGSTTDSSSRFYGDLFVPFSFLMFNLWDFIGRTAAGVYNCIPNTTRGHRVLVFATILRVAFVPAFLWCNARPDRGYASMLTPVFTSDVWPIVFMILMSFTNGYFSSICMMFGPTLVQPESMATAGTMMVFCLTCGLLTGSLSSFGWIPLFRDDITPSP